MPQTPREKTGKTQPAAFARGPSPRALRAVLAPLFLASVAGGGVAGRQLGIVCAMTDIVRFNVDPLLIPFFVYAIAAIGMMAGALGANVLWQLLLRALRRIWAAPELDRLIGFLGFTLGTAIGAAYTVPIALATMDSPGLLRTVGIAALTAAFGAAGATLGLGMRDAALRLAAGIRGVAPPGDGSDLAGQRTDGHGGARPKLLDTSVIIDGRIEVVCRAGFLEGEILAPQFVLDELQTIADCSDPIRRKRGRRGFLILSKMQRELGDRMRVIDDYHESLPDSDEVDIQLVHLAKAREATIVSNDQNLARVAELHGVPVINVNALASALKPVHMQGEELEVQIVKEGREAGQGVGYLDDGTMVVVEGAARLVGQPARVLVTSMIQTVAGKMVFAALAD